MQLVADLAKGDMKQRPSNSSILRLRLQHKRSLSAEHKEGEAKYARVENKRLPLRHNIYFLMLKILHPGPAVLASTTTQTSFRQCLQKCYGHE